MLNRIPRPLKVTAAMVVMAVLLFWGSRSCIDAVRTPEQPVEVIEAPTPAFTPVRVYQPLRVEPNPLVVGQAAAMFNGLCNDADYPVKLFVYLGLQELLTDTTLAARTIPLIGTQGTPQEIGLDASTCRGEELRVASVPDKIPPGTWRLVLDVRVQGQALTDVQFLYELSPPFDVVGAGPEQR